MKNFFSDGLSIDETRISIIIITYIPILVLAVYTVVTRGDIPDTLFKLMSLQLMLIGGVNVADKIGVLIGKKGGN